MGRNDFELVANVSLLFAELPLLDRFAAARDAGFQAVELWWPFDGPVPGDQQLGDFLHALEAAEIPLAGMNLWAGDQPAGERGVLSQPGREAAFESAVEAMAGIATATGCRVFNALYGQRMPGVDPDLQDRLAIDNLALATRELGGAGGTVLLEPLSRGLNGDYPILTVEDALRVIDAVRELSGLGDIALLFDTFHLSNNGEDLVEAAARGGGDIGHVQLADAPGRGEPGTGTIDFAAILDAIAATGYAGAVACEYVPSRPTLETLGWIAGTPHIALSR